MASVRVSTNPTLSNRTSTVGMRRVKSHEPGQRVMTEAIAFLFACKTSEPPTPEEFFTLCRALSVQTYHLMFSSPRRKIASRLLGSSNLPFSSLQAFLDTLETPTDDSLVARLLQAQNIGLQALVTFNAFVDDDSDKSLKTHIVEPYLWFSNILFHDSLDYQTVCGGAAMHFIQDGVAHLLKMAGRRRMVAYFEAYDLYKSSQDHIFLAQRKYLNSLLSN